MKIFVVFIISAQFLLALQSPYGLKKFQDILNISKLQAPTSKYNSSYSRKEGEFENFYNRYFYLQDGRYMTFFMCGYKNRSELREVEDWSVLSEKNIKIYAKVSIFPSNGVKEFTFLQIHSDPSKSKISINKPLLRVVWKKSYNGVKKHIWAIIKTSTKEKRDYKKIDLLKRADRSFTIEIEVKEAVLKIFIDKKLKVKADVGYWKNCKSYFKAGVYLQSKGCAKVMFDKLKIIR